MTAVETDLNELASTVGDPALDAGNVSLPDEPVCHVDDLKAAMDLHDSALGEVRETAIQLIGRIWSQKGA